MPATLPQLNDDLFKDSTMTFGEHLEELRRCLYRALIGLGFGVVIGLLVGSYVIDFIKSPLSAALDEYKTTAAIDTVQQELQQRREGGEVIADTYEADLIEAIRDQKLVFDDVYVSRDAISGNSVDEPSGPADSTAETGQANDPQAPPNDTADAEPGTPAEGAETSSALPDLVPIRIWRPVGIDPSGKIIGDNVTEAFMVYLKASLVAGIVFSSPWIFYQLWMFVAAGLYPHEKHYVYVFLPFSLGLFLFGASFAFFLVFKPVLNFLLSFNAWLGIDPYLRINAWLSFVLILPLGFGISFQLPLVMLFLERIGVFDAPAYKANLRIAILAICVIAMLLTPSDPYSMLLMAIPLVFLYLGGILLCQYWPRRQSPLEPGYGG